MMIKTLLTAFLTSKGSGYLAIACLLALLSIGGGVYTGVIRLADERCEGMVAEDKVTALEKDNAALRASLAKRTAIHSEVRNATDDALDRRAGKLGILRD